MVRVNIEFPDDVGEQLEELAREAGHPSIESYIRAVFVAGIDLTDTTLTDTTPLTDDELERVLDERVNDPAPLIEFTPQIVEDIERRVLGDRSNGG